MPTYSESDIREALESVVQTAAPNAVVFPWWALGRDERHWPGILKPRVGDHVGKVHGYVITRRRTYGERVNACRIRRFFVYQIRGLHFYDDTSNREANSDLAFNAELDAICEAFVNGASLPEALHRIPDESELDFTVDINLYGGELLHRAVGELTVEQC